MRYKVRLINLDHFAEKRISEILVFPRHQRRLTGLSMPNIQKNLDVIALTQSLISRPSVTPVD
ncbi:MAG: hypothetical protein WBQ60_09510, partial [Asticcacaulis sp.]